jgi:hypothetical protein
MIVQLHGLHLFDYHHVVNASDVPDLVRGEACAHTEHLPSQMLSGNTEMGDEVVQQLLRTHGSRMRNDEDIVKVRVGRFECFGRRLAQNPDSRKR